MAEVESFVVLSAQDVGSIAQYVGQSTLRVCVRAVYVMLALAVFAYAWQCWQFEKSLRMTGREIEEESKEGDPRSTLQLANVDVLLGLAPRYAIQDVLEGHKALDDVLVTGPVGTLMLPASSGVPELVELNEVQRLQLLTALENLEQDIDFLLIDTGAGISANRRLHLVAERFLNVSIDYLGFIPHATSFSQAVRQQKALFDIYPSSVAASGFRSLTQQLLTTPEAAPTRKGGSNCFGNDS